MRSRDRANFRHHIKQALALFQIEPTDSAYELWWGVLQPFTIWQVEKGFRDFLADTDAGRFAPRPADIKAKILFAQLENTNPSEAQQREAMRILYTTCRNGQSFRRLIAHRRYCQGKCAREGRHVLAEDVYVETEDPDKFFKEDWFVLCLQCHEHAMQHGLDKSKPGELGPEWGDANVA